MLIYLSISSRGTGRCFRSVLPVLETVRISPTPHLPGNPYLIDLDDLVKDGLLQETEIRSFNWGTDDADIDYATIYENRYKILRMAFSRFSAKSEDFLAFTEKSDRWLSDYSLYTALKRLWRYRMAELGRAAQGQRSGGSERVSGNIT